MKCPIAEADVDHASDPRFRQRLLPVRPSVPVSVGLMKARLNITARTTRAGVHATIMPSKNHW